MPSQTVTLQLGDFSSLSAVHFWNSLATQLRLAKWAQDDVFNFDAFFRDQSKLCPRSILFERPRPFRKVEDLGPISVDHDYDDLVKLGGYQGELHSWHDMSFVKFHQKAICDLGESFYNPQPALSDFFRGGTSGLATPELMSNAEDCIRFMAEECDGLGEFQFMTNAASAFGGLTVSIIEELIEDEYPKALIRTWASFANCKDFEFHSDPPSHSLVASALSRLSSISTQLIPIFLEPSNSAHFLLEEELNLGNALHASSVTAAAMDTVSTRSLLGTPTYSSEVLIDLKLSTPVHSMGKDPVFTSLSTGKQAVIQSWESFSHIKRMNHTEETFPGRKLTAEDLPIYSPNFAYSGYQQQASSSVALMDTNSMQLSDYIKGTLLKGLRRTEFVDLDDASDLFTEVRETLHSIVRDDE